MEKQHGQHPPLIKRVDWDAATCSNKDMGWGRGFGLIQKERSVLQWLLCLPVEFSHRFLWQAIWGNGSTTTINKHLNWSVMVWQGLWNGTDHDES